MSTPLYFNGLADSYLEWAHYTSFEHFHVWPGATHAGRLIGLLVRMKSGGSIKTRLLDPKLLKDPKYWKAWDRLELATPVAQPEDTTVAGWSANLSKLNQSLVLGVIDDGCPFAHPGMQAERLPKCPKVSFLWDQNPQGPMTKPLYGRRWTAADLMKAMRRHPEDDLSTYSSLGIDNLRRRATHGAHVLDVLTGPVEARDRVSPSRMVLEGGGDGSAHLPPSRQAAADPASKAPIVFVQLPRAAIEDPSGRWLGMFALDGLDYILSSLKTNPSKAGHRVVVNLSWGPQTGPHDGSSLLEQAWVERMAVSKAMGWTLDLTLPAGNTYEAKAHALFPADQGCDHLCWHVPPSLESPSFLEMWWPEGTLPEEVQLTIRAPDGSTLSATCMKDGGLVSAPHDTWGITLVPHNRRCMALLALAPTFDRRGGNTAPHGGWHIDIQPLNAPKTGDVHVYAARNQANMGGRRRGVDSYLEDTKHSRTHFWRDRPTPADAGLVKGEGTLNGLATGSGPLLAAGYVLTREAAEAETAAAPYSSSGPSADGTRNPDWALATDESPLLRGIRAGAVRGGTSVRLVGTSTAAPQLARKLANGETLSSPDELVGPPAPNRPSPITTRGRRLGHGRVVPMRQTPVLQAIPRLKTI
jgi:hypothetical protein